MCADVYEYYPVNQSEILSMKLSVYTLAIVISGLTACTWVEPTREGSEVIVVKASSVGTCNKLGTATTSVKHKLGIITRSDEKVTEELTILAKNKAAEMGGDSIVAKGEPVEGSMSFDIYKCGD
jgi:hypothetical protein